MFAVIRTGGKQYRVSKDDEIRVELLEGAEGSTVDLGDALFGTGGKKMSVTATILKHVRDRKILIFKKKRRQNYRRKNGHRQAHTILKINDIKG